MTDKKDNDYLLNSLILGNEKGIREIYGMVYPKVFSYILKHDGTEDDAKDIFQKSLLQFVVRAQTNDFKIKSTFEGYLFTICKNVWRRTMNKSKNMVTNNDVIYLVHEEREIALATLEQEKWELFHEKLAEISENCKKLLTYFFKKMAYIEIAEELGYNSENVVRQRIFKCKTKLKEVIQKDSRYNELKEL